VLQGTRQLREHPVEATSVATTEKSKVLTWCEKRTEFECQRTETGYKRC
jgi:hypothetical protein